MGKQEDFSYALLQNEYVDDEKMAVVASAKKLPNGEWGMCLLCINGKHLIIADTDMQQNIGQKLYNIDLANISDFKSSTFIFNSYIKFTFNHYRYAFANFGNAKKFVDVLQDRINN